MQNKLISFLQVWGIFLVVLGHSFTAVESAPLHKLIYCFHMPLFIFISGYLAKFTIKQDKISDSINYKRFIYKKTKRLIIPYIFISSLTFLPKAMLSAYALRPIDFSFKAYFHMLIYPLDNVIKFFWFLPTIYIISILTFLIINNIKGYNRTILFVIITCFFTLLSIFNPIEEVSILCFNNIAHYWIFYILGIIFYNIQNCAEKNKIYNNKFLTLALLNIFIVFVLYTNGSNLVNFLYAICGIALSISLGYLYIKSNLNFTNHLYGSTYAIYLFSWYPLVFIQSFIQKKVTLPWEIWAIICTIAQIYIPLLIYIFLVHYKNKNKYIRLLCNLVGH